MKNLILGLTSTVLLAMQASGQQLPAPTANTYSYSSNQANANVNVTVNSNATASTKSTTNTSYTYSPNVKEDQADDPMKSKTFSKSFTVDRSDKINLANTYGSITIKTWAKNEIKVDVDIKAYANTEKDAQDLLDNASISASKDGNDISFKTKVDERSNNWGIGSRNGKRWRRELKVYYVVYMPVNNPLNASQTYGSITMEDYNGPTSLKVQYGNLTTGDLKSSNNYISVQYGKVTLQNVNTARINLQYGNGLTMGDINDLEIDAQYTAVTIGNVKNNAQIKHQYGRGVTMASAGSLSATIQYADLKVGRLSGTFTGKLQYGKLTVDAIEQGCRIFNADVQYTGVVVGFAPGYNADFDVHTEYAGFTYGSNVTAKREGGEDRSYSSTKNYTGQVGRGGSNKINIKMEYKSLIFK